MNYQAIATWIALVGLLCTLWAVYWQNRHNRLSMCVDLVLRLEQQFDTQEMRAMRAAAAAAFEGANHGAAVVQIERISDFFDGIAFLVKRKALDKEMAWHYFHFYFARFWHYAKTHATEERRRRDDQRLWERCDWLERELSRMEECRSLRQRLCVWRWWRRSAMTFTADELRRFIDEEKALLPCPCNTIQ